VLGDSFQDTVSAQSVECITKINLYEYLSMLHIIQESPGCPNGCLRTSWDSEAELPRSQ